MEWYRDTTFNFLSLIFCFSLFFLAARSNISYVLIIHLRKNAFSLRIRRGRSHQLSIGLERVRFMLCKTLPSPFDVLKFDILTRKTGFFQKVGAVWSFIKRHLQALLSSLFPSSLARSLLHCSPAFLARLYYSIEPLNSLRIRGRFVFQCDGRNLSPSPALLARPLKKITGAYAKASTTRSFLCKRSRVLLNLIK